MVGALPKMEGLRERNRRQTRDRIVEVAVDLFLARGYEATTLDEIAAAAGISRRTFFYYFESKDDILLARVGRYADAVREAIRKGSPADAPVDVVRDALLALSTEFESSRTIATARLIRESKALRTSRQRNYMDMERALFEGLCELWPAKERRERLRIVAAASMAVMRLATDAWLEQDGKRALAKYVQDGFRHLKAEI